jgi:phosphopantothenoylcysteine decarboxylase/phosphopantothenate--cysteine ligase
MGIALAAAAARRGADVTLIAANVALPEPPGVHRIDVETTAELAKATRDQFATKHVLLMAAAPADFRAAESTPGKIERTAGGIEVPLEPTEDILAGLKASRSNDRTIVAFAAEAGNNIDRAREKLQLKGADLMVLNDISNPSIGFESSENAVTLIDAANETSVPQASKDTIADAILDRVDQLRSKTSSGAR